jgi:hypothetical protein
MRVAASCDLKPHEIRELLSDWLEIVKSRWTERYASPQ